MCLFDAIERPLRLIISCSRFNDASVKCDEMSTTAASSPNAECGAATFARLVLMAVHIHGERYVALHESRCANNGPIRRCVGSLRLIRGIVSLSTALDNNFSVYDYYG